MKYCSVWSQQDNPENYISHLIQGKKFPWLKKWLVQFHADWNVLFYIRLFTLITLSEGDSKVMLISEFSIETF